MSNTLRQSKLVTLTYSLRLRALMTRDSLLKLKKKKKKLSCLSTLSHPVGRSLRNQVRMRHSSMEVMRWWLYMKKKLVVTVYQRKIPMLSMMMKLVVLWIPIMITAVVSIAKICSLTKPRKLLKLNKRRRLKQRQRQ